MLLQKKKIEQSLQTPDFAIKWHVYAVISPVDFSVSSGLADKFRTVPDCK